MKLALAVLIVLLAAAPSAAAKGVASAEVCGAGDCRALIAHGAVALDNLIPFGTAVGAPRRLPFYRLRLTFRGPNPSILADPAAEPAAQVVDATYVPAARAAHFGGRKGADPWRGDDWLTLARPSLAAFRRATAGLEPLPPGALKRGGAQPAVAATPNRPAREGGGAAAPFAVGGALVVLALAGGALIARRRRRWLIPVLAGAAIVPLMPAEAGAKLTCQERGTPLRGIEVHGLPAQPVAGRTYTLTVRRPAVRTANPSPHLGSAYCGRATPEPTGGWFQRSRGEPYGVFSLDVRFSRPGPWALSFMDSDGSFHDFGLRHVEPPPPRATWLSASAVSLAVAGLLIAN